MTRHTCTRCGCLCLGTEGSMVDDSGLCTVCREEPDFAIASHYENALLRNRAIAERGSHPEEPRIHCRGPGCTAFARERWSFCSRTCRDAYVRISANRHEHS